MALKPNRYLNNKAAVHLAHFLNRVHCGTFRLKIENERPWLEHINNGGKILLCSWHQHLFTMFGFVNKYAVYSPTLLVSRSRDGDIVADVARLIGWTPVRGSSSNGGFAGLFSIIKQLRKGCLAGHVVDGPRGPAGRVKSGTLRLAHATGARVVPVSVVPDRAWYANSWDKFMVPKPFSAVTIRYGEMMALETTKDQKVLEEQRKRLESVLRPGLKGF